MNDKVGLKVLIISLVIGLINQYSSFRNALIFSLLVIIIYLIMIFHNNLVSIQSIDNHLESLKEILKKISDKEDDPN